MSPDETTKSLTPDERRFRRHIFHLVLLTKRKLYIERNCLQAATEYVPEDCKYEMTRLMGEFQERMRATLSAVQAIEDALFKPPFMPEELKADIEKLMAENDSFVLE